MSNIDIRRDDDEPLWQHQVERDELVVPKTEVCSDPSCDIKMQPHGHKCRPNGQPAVKAVT